MVTTQLTDADVRRAMQIWDDYQKQHDVSDRVGQTAGIDPVSGQVWIGSSISAVVRQMQAEGIDRGLYIARVGYPYYYRKGGHL